MSLRSVPGRFKVLFVDDDTDALVVTGSALRQAGADVMAATSVEQAIGLLRAYRPDVIVSDIGMPGCDGYQLMRMVRSRTRAEGGYTPAIALTGYTRDEDHTRALLAGYQLHLGKPVRIAELVAAIEGVLARE